MLTVAVLDVGSARNTGWWRSPIDGEPSHGVDVDSLCDEVAADLSVGNPVALGFEAPLWMPYASTAAQLGKARPQEHPSWGAGAGATVLTHGIQQMTYVLHRIAGASGDRLPVPTLNPEDLRDGDAELLIWEAFVSGRAKDRTAADPHVSDARAAGLEFIRRWRQAPLMSDLGDVDAVSLAGLALLRSGLTSDAGVVTAAPVVVRAPDLPLGDGSF